MIHEMRAVRLELDNQRHFTPEKKPIELTREYVEKWTVGREAPSVEVAAAQTAKNFQAAAHLIEVG